MKKSKFIKVYFENTGNIAHICRELKMSRQTFYDWVRRDPEFATAIEDEDEAFKDFAESKLIEKINKGDTIALLFYLKCKAKDRGYVEKVEHDVRGALFEHLKVEIEFVESDGNSKDQD
jgi:predicted DNA-binding protein YlxM (UPF0122 family)